MIDGKLDGKIARRMNEGRKIIGNVGAITRNKNVTNKAKIIIYDSVFTPTVLYGSEIWTPPRKEWE